VFFGCFEVYRIKAIPKRINKTPITISLIFSFYYQANLNKKNPDESGFYNFISTKKSYFSFFLIATSWYDSIISLSSMSLYPFT
jgi:hypothetical protein